MFRQITEAESATKLSAAGTKKLKALKEQYDKLALSTKLLHEIQDKNERPYFLWHLYFKDVFEQGGFDIVIGNPPYIQLQSMGKEADKLQQIGYKTFERTGDIYCLFYELGKNILKENGLLCFITSNKWMRAGYGESLRNLLVTQTNPLRLIDFAGFKVFNSATVDTNILLFRKAQYKQQTLACSMGKDFGKDGLEKMSDYIGQFLNPISFSENSSWVILSPIEQRIKRKIEKVGKPLKEWDINIYRGILTGYNEAFIIDGKTKDELIAKSPKSAEIIRPILRGRDIKRYKAEFADLWILNVHNGTPSTPPININDYPEVKAYLDQFYPALEKRQDKGITPYNLRSCIYTDDFSKQKIVWKIIGNQMAFSIDSNGYIVNNACYILTGSCLEYLLAVMNSKTIKWYSFITNMNKTGVGDVQVGGQNVNLFPIPLLPENEQKPFIELVNKITTDKDGKNTDVLETEIDNLIYRMYCFTDEEITFIDSL